MGLFGTNRDLYLKKITEPPSCQYITERLITYILFTCCRDPTLPAVMVSPKNNSNPSLSLGETRITRFKQLGHHKPQQALFKSSILATTKSHSITALWGILLQHGCNRADLHHQPSLSRFEFKLF